jgi:23S rRNA (cytosine1962-C5)-methyltransferase
MLPPDLLLTAKPAGIATHSPGEGRPGFVEDLMRSLGVKLWVCHRLDKETSGAIVFARTAEAAAELGKLFESHQVAKEYLFVSDRMTALSEKFIHRSHIKKFRGRFVSWKDHAEPNAETEFEYIKRIAQGSLWRARPKSGKPHQIRLHARDCGIKILGDRDHGGSPFDRLMLHAQRISFSWRDELVDHCVETEW